MSRDDADVSRHEARQAGLGLVQARRARSVVVELPADELHAEGDVRRTAGSVYADLHRPAVFGHLREELAYEAGLAGFSVDLRLVVQVSAADTPDSVPSRYSDVGLNAPDARPAEVLALLGDVGADLHDRDVRHGVLDAVVEPRGAHRDDRRVAATLTPISPPFSRSGPRLSLASVSTVPTRNCRYSSFSVGARKPQLTSPQAVTRSVTW